MTRSTKIILLVLLIVCLVWLAYRVYRSGSDTQTGTSALGQVQGGPESAYPDVHLTPGAIDTRVTQDNVQSTICVPGYTKTVRPPSNLTHRLKLQIMAAYGLNGDPSEYELDHFIPLELGGCGDCVANLWPEPYNSEFGAKEKDRVDRKSVV